MNVKHTQSQLFAQYLSCVGKLINSNEVYTNVNHRHSCDAWNKCNIPRAVVVNLPSHSSRKLYHDRPWYIKHLQHHGRERASRRLSAIAECAEKGAKIVTLLLLRLSI